MSKAGALLLVFLTVILLSPRASASTAQQCDLNLVGFNNDSSGINLYMSCSQDTHVYVLYNTPSGGNLGCGTVTMDTLKMVQSVATSARLGGRRVQIWWNTCTGSTNLRTIASIDF